MLLEYIRKIKNGENTFYSINRISELACKKTVSAKWWEQNINISSLQNDNDQMVEVHLRERLIIWGTGRWKQKFVLYWDQCWMVENIKNEVGGRG